MKRKVLLTMCLILLLVIGLVALTGCGNRKEEKKTTNTNAQSEKKDESIEDTKANKDSSTTPNYQEYDYKDGVLTQIVDEEGNPEQTDFVMNGLILIGNRHSYSDLEAGAERVIEKLVSQGYLMTGINSSFYLNEYIEFYIDTPYTGLTSNVKILAVPHKTVEEYQKMSLSQLEELANENGGFVLDYEKPDEDNFKYVGEGYINMDYPEGQYDILFTYKGKLAYFITVSLTKPTE